MDLIIIKFPSYIRRQVHSMFFSWALRNVWQNDLCVQLEQSPKWWILFKNKISLLSGIGGHVYTPCSVSLVFLASGSGHRNLGWSVENSHSEIFKRQWTLGWIKWPTNTFCPLISLDFFSIVMHRVATRILAITLSTFAYLRYIVLGKVNQHTSDTQSIH